VGTPPGDDRSRLSCTGKPPGRPPGRAAARGQRATVGAERCAWARAVMPSGRGGGPRRRPSVAHSFLACFFSHCRLEYRLRAAARRTETGRSPHRAPGGVRRPLVDGGVPGVSERGGEPPGPIPNPVVPPASAGGVLGGQPPGKRGPRARHPPPHQPPSRLCLLSLVRVAGWSSGSSLGS
jgi:hypothetical protein